MKNKKIPRVIKYDDYVYKAFFPSPKLNLFELSNLYKEKTRARREIIQLKKEILFAYKRIHTEKSIYVDKIYRIDVLPVLFRHLTYWERIYYKGIKNDKRYKIPKISL